MKAYAGMKVGLFSFLTSALSEGEPQSRSEGFGEEMILLSLPVTEP
jgi:hypothetical protein